MMTVRVMSRWVGFFYGNLGWVLVCTCLWIGILGEPGWASDLSTQGSSDGPVSRLSINLPQDAAFCGEKVPLHLQEIRERFEKEILLTLWHRPQVILWLKRSRRYFPIIEQKLEAAGLPQDLKFMAVIESALRPHARSRKGAIGFWQFLSATGRKYGLRIDHFVDQRRNVYDSTDAAINYLKALYSEFGSWTLVAAAYNMGEEGLKAEILAQKASDYYQLLLPTETQRYLFRILAAKMVLSQPKKYGFSVDPNAGYPAYEFDRISLTVSRKTPIHIVADAADTYYKRIKDLNPELRGYYLPPGTHTLLVPKGSGGGVPQRFENLSAAWHAEKNECVYIVKKGDNLSSIAIKFNVPLPSIYHWNRLDAARPIHPGDRIILYPADEIACQPRCPSPLDAITEKIL